MKFFPMIVVSLCVASVAAACGGGDGAGGGGEFADGGDTDVSNGGDIDSGPGLGADAHFGSNDSGKGDSGNPNPGCTPKDCAAQNIHCGAAGDGCGGVIQCGSCTPPATCGGGGNASTCGGTSGCQPKTCQQLGIDCGPASDTCGTLLQCGSCPNGQTCGGGGTPFKCGSATSGDGGLPPNCTPKTCAQQNANCGPVADGCGNLLSCGPCASPQTCGGGGVPSQCGLPSQAGGDAGASDGGNPFCTPKTCAQLGVNCGPAGDGCGGTLNCGSCPSGQSCGGGGVPSQCGAPQCKPITCAQQGISCGPAGDGCGNTLNCGSCSAPQSCGGGGVAGVCGAPSCTPKTCAQLGANCGFVADGCGNAINCGSCASPLFCGGGGANQCGNGSDAGGSTCDGGGTTTLTGYVFDPGNHLPVYNALVYVPQGSVQAPQTGIVPTQCGCSAPPAYASAYTDVDGKFTMNGVPAGSSVTVVVELGKWQRIFTESVTACVANNLGGGTAGSASNLTLPSNRSQGNIPRFAIDTGAVDTMECVLLKMGIAQSEFVNPAISNGKPTAAGRIHIYQGAVVNGGAVINSSTPNESALTQSASVMDSYDVLLFPCQGGAGTYDATSLSNLETYANDGGRAFATHFHYDLINGNGSFSGTANWTLDSGSWGGPFTGNIDQGFPRGAKLAQWLKQPIVYGGTLGQIPVNVIRNDFSSVNAPAQRWMYTTNPPDQGLASMPIHYTFDTPFNRSPSCGRVVYSDFHVENASNANGVTFPNECASGGLTAQEKLLEFMLFDLTSCVSPPACVPKTCAQQGITCGSAGDGCGGQLSCGSCAAGQSCQGSPQHCVNNCTPQTCAQQGKNCGPSDDGCGGALSCGTCTPPQICGGGGQPGVCGGTSCTPKTCAQQGIQCGPAGDGCGNLIQCGSCAQGQVCGGGGPGICGVPDGGFCAPITCAQQNLKCGPAGDGCGNVIQCGSCPNGQSCGGGGVPGQCGAPSCTPLTCTQQGLNCGPAGDGCGGTLNCGTCPAGQQCGGGGQPGVCGIPKCTPTTCAAQGANCGPIANGCGGTIDCGTCTSPDTCGGGGVANVCGSTGPR